MKKKKFNKKLSLNKETISNLDSSKIKGGQIGFTGGCTDGCGGSVLYCSQWNCTNQDCTADCNTIEVCNSMHTCQHDSQE